MSDALRRAFNRSHREGCSVAIVGLRGGGKSHLAMRLAEHWTRQGGYVMTNILMMMRTRTGWKETLPPRFFRITSVAALYYETTKVLLEEPDARILVILDETQNFMIAHRASAQMEVELFRLEGDSRKWHHCRVYLTPSFAYIPKPIRDDYISCIWTFSGAVGWAHLTLIKRFLHMDTRTGEITQKRVVSAPKAVEIGTGTFAVRPEDAEVGRIIFDTGSSASFEIGFLGSGQEMNLKDFRRHYTGVISPLLPETVMAYYERHGGVMDPRNTDANRGGQTVFDRQVDDMLIRRGVENSMRPKDIIPLLRSMPEITFWRQYKSIKSEITEGR